MALDVGAMLVRKRDGRVVPFDVKRIRDAMAKAFRADLGIPVDQPLPDALEAEVEGVTRAVVEGVSNKALTDQGADVEFIQNNVEEELMRRGHFTIARSYILYRAERTRLRSIRRIVQPADQIREPIHVVKEDQSVQPLQVARIRAELFEVFRGLDGRCTIDDIEDEVFLSLHDGISSADIQRALILVARQCMEREPAYDRVATRLLLRLIYREALGVAPTITELDVPYREGFVPYLQAGVEAGRIDAKLLEYDLERLQLALRVDRDDNFRILGLQTLYDRYLLHIDQRRIETPQYFWMRVAMGLAQNEDDREARAIEFYEVLSRCLFVSATPTLFNSGTPHPQLSSCYLSTVSDDLEGIFKCISDNASLSKWAGGLGNDWTPIRATGSHIKGTNGESQGVIPFLKIVNDTAVAVNQGGKRKGAVCAYLETWHLDIESFVELRKNTGDERRRTHDMNTANWVPDLFMQRVDQNGRWTLFSPDEVPDLHDLYGKAFTERYEHYERQAKRGQIRRYKEVEARDLWRQMLSMLFETGHPWITFKDPSNIRSPQNHVGVVHSSNLCTEILLNTSSTETAVCNLGSLNLPAHTTPEGIDEELLAKTVATAMRMLDNVIDINFYPTAEAKRSNTAHRPVGLGVMGFQDALYIQRIPYASQEAVEFADLSMELISYHAILASSELAAQRGPYASYQGSKWDRGLLPIDTIDLLEQERGEAIEMNRDRTQDWGLVRSRINRDGMRNSNVLAIAPTATISNIAGVSQSIEPIYRNLYAKSNLSGDFTILNPYLVRDLQRLDLWDRRMIEDLKYYDGVLAEISRIPEELRRLYLAATQIEPAWLIECAARRQKWIDMGQSLNLYISTPSGKAVDDMYFLAWRRGLKTTYYLRSFAPTQIEKTSIDINARAIQPRWMKSESASSRIAVKRAEAPAEVRSTVNGLVCDPFDEECEACQ